MTPRVSSEDRKSEILSVTLDLAFKVGPDHVTTGLIAERIGVTQPAIYKHFPKKQDIWLAATEILCARISANSAQGAKLGQPALENLRGLVLGHLQLVTEFPALPEIMVARDPTGRLSESRRKIQAAMGEFRAALSHCFEAARATKSLRDELCTQDAVVLLLGIIQSLVLRLIVSRDPAPLVKEGERLLELQLMLFEREGK